MATTNAGVSRNEGNIVLPKQVSSEIWMKTIESSAFTQLAQRRTLAGAGEEIQTIEGQPVANWVNETDVKPISKPTLGSTSWKGYTMSVIIPFSNQFRRDKSRLYDEIVRVAPLALGTKLDKTIFGGDAKPGELFDTLDDASTVDVETDVWGGLVTADAMIAANDGVLDGFVVSPAFKSILLTERDTMGRPLFINSMTAESNVANLMGQRALVKKNVFKSGTPNQLGFAGDWSNAYYGVVEDITMSISDQASLTTDEGTINLWERNMFAVRFEFEVGAKFKDKGQFVKLVGKTA